ncbi:hypothetical protein G7054_g7093 [Neopestalotiopsis clavispora]|nr:hypothetical protein G7054_g7093 [Neopestalotiopsis clavispora]
MKFLCLPGAYGNVKAFQVQLGPCVAEIEEAGQNEFVWTQGTYNVNPPEGFDDFFGEGPYYRFFDYDSHQEFGVFEKIRDFREGANPEETMRQLMADGASQLSGSFDKALQVLIDILDADPTIEGIMGYSEGAVAAASLILEESRRLQDSGRPRRIKRAVFFAGWPPLTLEDGKVQILLADQSEVFIDIPTLHVIGCNDPYISGAMALYNMCDEDSAEIFDHGLGHTIPRDQRTIHELGDVFGQFVVRPHA